MAIVLLYRDPLHLKRQTTLECLLCTHLGFLYTHHFLRNWPFLLRELQVNLAKYVGDVLKGTGLPHDVFLSPLVVKGFLTKAGADFRKNWKLRWFVLDLTEQTLSYYADDKAGAALCGQIALPTICKVVMPRQSEAAMLHTLLVVTLHRTYHMRATNDKSLVAWFYLLQACVGSGEGSGGGGAVPSAALPRPADRPPRPLPYSSTTNTGVRIGGHGGGGAGAANSSA